jgi:hypothetical protein
MDTATDMLHELETARSRDAAELDTAMTTVVPETVPVPTTAEKRKVSVKIEPMEVEEISSTLTAEDESVTKESSPRASDVWGNAKESKTESPAAASLVFPRVSTKTPTKLGVFKEKLRDMFETQRAKTVVTTIVLLNVVFIVIDSLDGANHGSSVPKCGYLCPEKTVMDISGNAFTFFFAFEFILRLIAAERYFKAAPAAPEAAETRGTADSRTMTARARAIAADQLLDDISDDNRFFGDPFNACDFVSFFPDMVVFVFRINAEIDALRVLKMFRLIKLFRNSLGIKLVFNTLRNSMEALMVPLVFLMTLIFVFSVLILFLEGCEDINECGFDDLRGTMYFTVVTVTTVGYGDQSPSLDNETSMWVGMILMFVGITYMAMPIAVIGAEFERLWKSSPLHDQRTNFSQLSHDSKERPTIMRSRMVQLNNMGHKMNTFSHDYILEQYVEMAELLSTWQTVVLDILSEVAGDVPTVEPSPYGRPSVHAAFSSRQSGRQQPKRVEDKPTGTTPKATRSSRHAKCSGKMHSLATINRKIRTKHKMLRMDIEKVTYHCKKKNSPFLARLKFDFSTGLDCRLSCSHPTSQPNCRPRSWFRTAST